MADPSDSHLEIAFYAENLTLFAIACAVSTLRYAKQRQRHGQLLIEDWIHIFALFQCYSLLMISFVPHINSGAGPLGQSPEQSIITVADLWKVTSLLYISTVYTSKAVFLALYLRIFGISRRFRKAWYAIAVLTVVGFIFSFLIQFWQCAGEARVFHWHDTSCTLPFTTPSWLPGETIAALVLDSVTDLLLVSLPLVMILRLQMQRSRKSGFAAILALGLIATAFNIGAYVLEIASDYAASSIGGNALAFILNTTPPLAVILAALPAVLIPGKSRTGANRRQHRASNGLGIHTSSGDYGERGAGHGSESVTDNGSRRHQSRRAPRSGLSTNRWLSNAWLGRPQRRQTDIDLESTLPQTTRTTVTSPRNIGNHDRNNENFQSP